MHIDEPAPGAIAQRPSRRNSPTVSPRVRSEANGPVVHGASRIIGPVGYHVATVKPFIPSWVPIFLPFRPVPIQAKKTRWGRKARHEESEAYPDIRPRRTRAKYSSGSLRSLLVCWRQSGLRDDEWVSSRGPNGAASAADHQTGGPPRSHQLSSLASNSTSSPDTLIPGRRLMLTWPLAVSDTLSRPACASSLPRAFRRCRGHRRYGWVSSVISVGAFAPSRPVLEQTVQGSVEYRVQRGYAAKPLTGRVPAVFGAENARRECGPTRQVWPIDGGAGCNDG